MGPTTCAWSLDRYGSYWPACVIMACSVFLLVPIMLGLRRALAAPAVPAGDQADLLTGADNSSL